VGTGLDSSRLEGMAKMITLKNLSKSYGSFKAVNDISLHVPSGGIFAFLGVNGAGKTTTIKMITGILKPSLGSIYLGGYDLGAEPLQAKAITGYIPDRPNLYPKLTGREFLNFMCDLYRVPAKQAERRIDEVLEEYTLTQWQDELIESYSHGMKQRIATCGALVHDPRVLIVDEPMVGLDPHGARNLKDAFKRYAKSGVTIFLSTHSLNVAEELADNLAIIHKGSILTTGTLEDIRALTGKHDEGLEDMFLELTSPSVEH
jgi:ABC-2 type transport system ATP-binding protein